MNFTIISGRLTRDPEARYGTDESKNVTRFTTAVARAYVRDGKRETDFFNCTAFGKNATFAEKYLKKGSKVVIRGHMEQDNYTNKDGQKVYDWKLVVDEIDFGESKSDRTTDGSISGNSGDNGTIEPKTDENGFMDIPDNLDVPFM